MAEETLGSQTGWHIPWLTDLSPGLLYAISVYPCTIKTQWPEGRRGCPTYGLTSSRLIRPAPTHLTCYQRRQTLKT